MMTTTRRRFVVQEIVECPKCNAVGSTRVHEYTGTGRLVMKDEKCKNCDGSGYVYKVVPLQEALTNMGFDMGGGE